MNQPEINLQLNQVDSCQFFYIIHFFLNPKIALFIFTMFIISYIVYLGNIGAFTKSFLNIGPGVDEENTTSFIGIKLDTWEKVILLYIVGFLSALLTSYYDTVMSDHIHMYLWNKAITEVPYKKTWIYLIVLLEPFLYRILGVIEFFTSLTLQLQFIIPQFIGSYIAHVPFTLYILNQKTFLG